MSKPPTTTTSLPPQPPTPALPSSHHHQPPPPQHLPTTITTPTIREYRKGNWTIQETLTLITAKKIDDDRRSTAAATKSYPSSSSSKPVELKWKWVENYCWAHGCFRSQNQCNDKWDNLLRDYKRVREYQSRSSQSNSSDQSHHHHHQQQFPSYFSLERHQRKERNLPSNMSQEVFEALTEVVQRRFNTANVSHQQRSSTQQFSVDPSTAPMTSRPVQPLPVDVPEPSDSSGTESKDRQQDSETKRNKVRKIGSSVMHSASVLAQTLNSSEEKKQKRHQELMELEQRRLVIEETRNEVNQQGIANLVAAMTNLSGAIQSLITSYYDQT